ncbi:Oxygen-dependent choline dehydrogenase [compost metagenome]
MIAQPAWDQIRGEPLDPGLEKFSDEQIEEWLRANVSTQYHPCGTCKMGSDSMAVVDQVGRVHGLTGIRVVDASIIPSLTSGNLNAPTIMLAEKIAAALTACTSD